MSRTGKIILLLAGVVILALIGYELVKAETTTLHWTGSYDPKPGPPPRPAVKVATYQIRYGLDSTKLANDSTYGTFLPYPGVPADSGKADSVLVTGLPTESVVYFSVRAVDSSGLADGWSNIAMRKFPDRTPPARVIDLK